MSSSKKTHCHTKLASGNLCIRKPLVGSPYCDEHTVDAMHLAEQERDAAQAACAELRQALLDNVGPNLHHGKVCVCKECKAFRLTQSAMAGKGWVNKELFLDAIERLEDITAWAKRSANKDL